MTRTRRAVRWLPRRLSTAIVVGAAVTLAGCGVSPANMDMRNPLSDGDQYEVKLQFADVLNLPIGARISLGGLTVGRVKAVALGEDAATVTVRMDKSVSVPSDIHASVLQDTLLGEAYVRLEMPEKSTGATQPLRAGAVLPQTQTSPPRSVESTLTILADYFGSGSVQDVSKTIERLNTALPKERPQFDLLSTQLSRDVTGLGANTAEVNRLLDSATEMADRIAKQEANFKDTLTPYHMKYWANQGKLMSNIGVLLPAVGGMLQQGYWLIPLMNSSSDLFELLTADMVSLGSAIHGGSVLVNKNLVPFVTKPVVKIDSVTNTAGQDVSPGAIKVLRLIGQAR
ncbi:MlaD family protein [Tsukamurella pulmonis]|uniref:MlaD family protein n=1 Tax=Tsukamurella pulmonis TaxID=47312 RepID=UPI000E08F091|nr:MlaD family protein [Tsukamurella pulmonis]RDH09604.1 MCE family protein [Tsukamurella pulmonis]